MRTLLLALLLACGGSAKPDPAAGGLGESDADADADADADLGGYAFSGRTGESSVAYEGQVFRHLLIVDLKAHLGGLTDRLNDGYFPESGEVMAELDFYFRFDGETSGSVQPAFTASLPLRQASYDAVSSGKDLVGKIAGNDATGQHKDWSTEFVGWSHPDVTTPESLVQLWFAEIDDAAVAWSNGEIPLDPTGAPVPDVAVSADGLDRRELLAKFLTVSVAWSQGADDYLDDDLEGAGLLADHSALVEGKPYTELEHAWDEGFGYFGASRDYCSGDDAVIASPGWSDSYPADGQLDLLTEVCWGHSTNAAKRDLGATVATDFTGEAWSAFLAGRTLLATTSSALTAAQQDELATHRDQALAAWEAAIAATVVHYLNEVVRMTSTFGTSDYVFADHAKAWSELKGFALGLQFNPHSPLSDDDFAALHAAIGQAPLLPGATPQELDDHVAALLAARAILGEAYGFDAENLGGADGLGGW